MINKRCMAIGHRDLPAEKLDDIREGLRQEILLAVEDGYTHFISGFARGSTLRDSRAQGIEIRLIEI